MGKRLTGFVIALLMTAAVAATTVSGQEPPVVNVKVMRGGAPAANVTIEFSIVNGGKWGAGATGTNGDLSVAMQAVNGGKPVRLQVVIYDCQADQSIVVFVEAGAATPENRECKRRVVGWFWFGRGRLVTIDLAAATLQATGQSFLSTRNGKLIAGGGAALLGAVALTAGGGDSSSSSSGGQSGTQGGTSFDPGGNYGVTNSVASDPGEHRFFILMEDSTVLTVTITGSTITITCPPNSKWTQITGTFNPSTGQITGEGRGTAAGRSNVLFRFTGTITMSGSNQGTLAGSLTIGAGGELPGGQPIVYNVSGRKQ